MKNKIKKLKTNKNMLNKAKYKNQTDSKKIKQNTQIMQTITRREKEKP